MISCLRPPTFWERGPARYGMLSYSLWARHIYWDFRGKKPPKKGVQKHGKGV